MYIEFDHEVPLYSIKLIHKDGTSELSLPSRMNIELAHQFAKGTLEEEESIIDYEIIEVSDKEAEALL